ncbi:MAG: hypothetical protein QOJ22_1203, partial [Thermoleophilaceae bacterium]|nr:hypothetical protein [Thermoleophilaceae bacterium]
MHARTPSTAVAALATSAVATVDAATSGVSNGEIRLEPPSLEAAIRQLIELGFKDPLTIARRLESTHEPGWLAAQLAMLSEDLIAEIARKQLG